jgi:sugar phosphate isomerase/epimerase
MFNSRRQFLQAAVAAGAGLTLGQQTTSAIEPIQRNGKPLIKLSVAAYGYRKYLALNLKPKPSMTLEDFADIAAGMNLGAIEPTAYYFSDTSPEYMAKLKGKCTRLGLDISGTAIGNNFCILDPEKLKEQQKMVRDWVENTARLGGKTVRIFAGTMQKGDTEEKCRQRVAGLIQESCDFAAKYGIILALENHGGIVTNIDQMLTLVKMVKHDWFGVNWDTGNFHSEDPYSDLTKLAPYAVVVQIKTEIQRGAGKPKEEANLKRLLDILRGVNFRGYVALEYEGSDEPKTAIPKAVATLQKLLS